MHDRHYETNEALTTLHHRSTFILVIAIRCRTNTARHVWTIDNIYHQHQHQISISTSTCLAAILGLGARAMLLALLF